MVITVSILLPSLLDNLLDYWSFDSIDSNTLERSMLLWWLFISYTGQYFSSYSQYHTSIYLSFYCVNLAIYYAIPLLILYRINPFFHIIPVGIILSTFYSFIMCALWGVVLSSNTLITVGLSLRYAAFAITVPFLLAFYYVEVYSKCKYLKVSFSQLMRSSRGSRSPIYTQNSIVVTSAYFILMCAFILPSFFSIKPGINNQSLTYLRGYFFFVVVGILVVSVLVQRLIRRESDMAQATALADLQNKKQFVR